MKAYLACIITVTLLDYGVFEQVSLAEQNRSSKQEQSIKESSRHTYASEPKRAGHKISQSSLPSPRHRRRRAIIDSVKEEVKLPKRVQPLAQKSKGDKSNLKKGADINKSAAKLKRYRFGRIMPELKPAQKSASRQEYPNFPAEDLVDNHKNDQLNKAYSLYDSGSNQRLLGNYALALTQLTEARQLLDKLRLSQAAENLTEAHYATPGLLGSGEPLEILALFELAQAAEGARNYEVARQSFQECIDLNPKFLPAYLKLACLEACQGKTEEALKIARQAMSLAPADPRPHSIMVNLLGELGLTEEARAEMERVKALSPGSQFLNPP